MYAHIYATVGKSALFSSINLHFFGNLHFSQENACVLECEAEGSLGPDSTDGV